MKTLKNSCTRNNEKFIREKSITDKCDRIAKEESNAVCYSIDLKTEFFFLVQRNLKSKCLVDLMMHCKQLLMWLVFISLFFFSFLFEEEIFHIEMEFCSIELL